MFGRLVKQFGERLDKLNKQISTLKNDGRFATLEQRLAALESDGRVGGLDERLSKLECDPRINELTQLLLTLEQEVRVGDLPQRLSALETDGRFAGLERRLATLEGELAQRLSAIESDSRVAELAQRLSALKSDGRVSSLERRIPALDDLEQRISSVERGFTAGPSRRSYSMEAEDLLLETVLCAALGHQTHSGGTYLDIGAGHPVSYSNTFYFYERGWSGICVEPNPDHHALYAIYRPRDKALNIGLGTQSETRCYHRFKQPLINGFYGQELVNRYISAGETYLGHSNVPCRSTREFLREHNPGPVDLLNIDVQILETEILAAWDWEACSPKLICVKNHAVNIKSMLDTEVASILERAGYTVVCRGRFSAIFVANENLERSHSLNLDHAHKERSIGQGKVRTRSRRNNSEPTQSSLEAIPGSRSLGRFIQEPKLELVKEDVLNALRVVDQILHASDEEIANREFLLQCLLDYGIPIMTSDIFLPWAKCMKQSGFGMLQFPTEFIDCLKILTNLNVKTAIEIGAFRGGSSYFMAAVLQRVCPEFELVMVDVQDSLLGFEEFSQKLTLRKAVPMTSGDFKGKVFDFVFIDGDHSYSGAMRDFLNVGKYANLAMAFHDIHGHEFDELEGGTVRAWGEIKGKFSRTHEVYEFAHSVKRSLGIGLVVRTTKQPPFNLNSAED
jgi:FkbM family methyltransferase